MRTLGILGSIPLLIASLACNTLQTGRAGSGEIRRAEGPGAVFYSVEDAAFDALTHAHSLRFPAGRPQMLGGTITQVEGGFSYTAPLASRRGYKFSAPRMRHRLGPQDVASYLVYAKRGIRRIDHEHERPTAAVMRIVDEIDPLQRPLFLLTPSLNVVRYDASGLRSIARLDGPRSRQLASER